MGAKGVVLHHVAPVGVHHPLTIRFGADAVAPVVFVRKASARPAQNGDFNLFQRLRHIGADAVYVGDGRAFADIQTLVNTAAQMLAEVAEQVSVHDARAASGVYSDVCHTVLLCSFVRTFHPREARPAAVLFFILFQIMTVQVSRRFSPVASSRSLYAATATPVA